VKVALGRHFVYASVVQPSVSIIPPLALVGINEFCPEQASYVQFYIDDPYDFDVNDPEHPNNPQYLPYPYPEAQKLIGFGLIPFEWLKELEVQKRATKFQTRVYWAKVSDFENHTVYTLYDVDLTRSGDPHVSAIK
jgi:hypothetical protein